MCKSVKGAAYFGSTVHLVTAFIFLVWFLFDTVISEVHINLWKCVPTENDPPRKYNDLVHYLNLPFKFLYYTILCVTGIYIFRGVERNAPRVIKFALLVFAITQIIGLSLFVTISLNYWDDEYTEALPVASRLNFDPNNNIPTFDQEGYELVTSAEEESGESYSINIEVFNHPPEVHHSQYVTQHPRFQSVAVPTTIEVDFDQEDKNSASSGPENLIIRQKQVNSTEISVDPPPDFDVIVPDSISTSGEDVVRIVHRDGREFLTFPSAPQSMVLQPGSISPTFESESGDDGNDPTAASENDFTAVLEPPPLNPTTTTPMPTTIQKEPEVVLVKIVPSGNNNNNVRKLSHNQLVNLVFQMFLVGFNAVGTFIYTGVLIVHLTTL